MDKATYLKAVRKAKRIFGYVQITDIRKQATRISKPKAAALVSQCAESDTIDAIWADGTEAFLLIG